MYSDNKQIRDVADVAARIMAGLPPLQEKLHPNQQKLDVHEPEKDELTADDFKKLRAGKKPDVKKEEVEIEEESHQSKTTMKHISNPTPAQKQAAKDIKPGVGGYRDRIAMLKDAGVKEEVESIDEVKMADLPSTKVQGRAYGASKPQPSAFDVLKGPKDKELKSIESEKKKKKMSEMVALYKDGGMKAFFESIKKEDLISEEPDSEQFAKELDDQKKRDAGTKRQADVAKASVQSVKQEKVEITDEMIFEVLENAGIDFETLSDDELQEVANEAYEILDEISTKTLAKAASAASDPDADYHYGKSHDPQKFADHAKKTKDAKSAAAVQGAANAKGHYTRPGHTLGSYDKLAHRTPARVTGAGKANKQDVNKLKKSISLNAEATDDIETTRQFRNAIAGVKARSSIDKAKDGPGAKYYADGAKVTPQETARRAAEAKAKKDKKGVTKESTEQDIYVIDADLANGVDQIDIEERMMTEPEKQKKEEMVKSMKKSLAGFKERYGDRAKSVMYATATKNAMKD